MQRVSAAGVLLLMCLFCPLPGHGQGPAPVLDNVDSLGPSHPANGTDTLVARPEECLDTDVCRPADHFQFEIDYILWWLREGRTPPLLTTSSAGSAGILGQPDTHVLYGGDRLETRHGDRFNGLRPALGYWFDDQHTCGIEASAFFLERDSTYFKALSDGTQPLARPLIAPDGASTSFLLAGPLPAGGELFAGNAVTGTLNGGFVGYSRVELFGEEVNLTTRLLAGNQGRLELLCGAHFLQMRDRIDLTSTGHPVADPATLVGLTDHFRVANEFYGGQVGLRAERVYRRWCLSVTGEVAPGATQTNVRAFGSQTYQTPFTRVVTPYGLAVQPSNAVSFSHSEFDVVSELDVNVQCRLTGWAKLFTGYTFLYWARCVRAGDQIELSSTPSIPFRTDAFWAQGLNAGMEFTW